MMQQTLRLTHHPWDVQGNASSWHPSGVAESWVLDTLDLLLLVALGVIMYLLFRWVSHALGTAQSGRELQNVRVFTFQQVLTCMCDWLTCDEQ